MQAVVGLPSSAFRHASRWRATRTTTRLWVVRLARKLRSRAQAEFLASAQGGMSPDAQADMAGDDLRQAARNMRRARPDRDRPPENQQISSRPHRRATPDLKFRLFPLRLCRIVPDGWRRAPWHATAFETPLPASRGTAHAGGNRLGHLKRPTRLRPNAHPARVNDPCRRCYDAPLADAWRKTVA